MNNDPCGGTAFLGNPSLISAYRNKGAGTGSRERIYSLHHVSVFVYRYFNTALRRNRLKNTGTELYDGEMGRQQQAEIVY